MGKKKETVEIDIGDMKFEVKHEKSVWHHYEVFRTHEINIFGYLIEIPFKKFEFSIDTVDGKHKLHLDRIKRRLSKLRQ